MGRRGEAAGAVFCLTMELDLVLELLSSERDNTLLGCCTGTDCRREADSAGMDVESLLLPGVKMPGTGVAFGDRATPLDLETVEDVLPLTLL